MLCHPPCCDPIFALQSCLGRIKQKQSFKIQCPPYHYPNPVKTDNRRVVVL